MYVLDSSTLYLRLIGPEMHPYALKVDPPETIRYTREGGSYCLYLDNKLTAIGTHPKHIQRAVKRMHITR